MLNAFTHNLFQVFHIFLKDLEIEGLSSEVNTKDILNILREKFSTSKGFASPIQKQKILNNTVSDLYRPLQPPQTPKIFENGALTPQHLEKLNFYFGRFSINSGESYFSVEIEVRKCKNRLNLHQLFVFFSNNFLIHKVV